MLTIFLFLACDYAQNFFDNDVMVILSEEKHFFFFEHMDTVKIILDVSSWLKDAKCSILIVY